MGFFDKLFKRRADGNIRIKFIPEKEKDDEQEKFLITIGDEKPKTVKKPVRDTKADENSSKTVITVNTDDEPSGSIPKTAKEKQQKPAEKKVTPASVSKKKTVPVSNADELPEEAGSVTVTEGKATRNGKFDIKKAKDGRYFFCLYASNYAVIAYSQIYSSSSAAMNGIKSIIANAGKTPIEDTTLKTPKSYPFPKWEIYIDRAGEYRFRLYAVNGMQICHSAHGYSTKSGCKGGIESIARFASDAAKIDKTYLK